MRAVRLMAGRHLLVLALAALGVVLAPGPSFPCDSTCCLMLTRGTSGLVGRGGFQIDLSYRYTDMSTRLDGSEPTDSVIRPKVLLETGQIIPGYHDDREGTESFVQLDAAWGVGSATTVFASWPVLTHKYYVIGHGGVQTTYNIRGVGDPVVGAPAGLLPGPGAHARGERRPPAALRRGRPARRVRLDDPRPDDAARNGVGRPASPPSSGAASGPAARRSRCRGPTRSTQ